MSLIMARLIKQARKIGLAIPGFNSWPRAWRLQSKEPRLLSEQKQAGDTFA